MREVSRRRTSCIGALRVPRASLRVPRGVLECRERRCERFHDVEPLASVLLDCGERLLECRERRCERFHDVEPLASVLLDCGERLLECREVLCECRERRCERFHDVEPLASALFECRGRRCERFHDVEPLASALFDCGGRLLECRAALFECRGALLECRGSRCERFHDVGPLASQLLRGAAPRSSRRASPDAIGHGPEPTGRAPDPTRSTPRREFTGRTEGSEGDEVKHLPPFRSSCSFSRGEQRAVESRRAVLRRVAHPATVQRATRIRLIASSWCRGAATGSSEDCSEVLGRWDAATRQGWSERSNYMR